MICGCVYVDEGQAPDLYTVRVSASRKQRRCCECGVDIKVGDQYENVWGIWEGEANTYITCATCLEIRNLLFCYGWMHETMWSDLKESFAYNDSIPWVTIGTLSKTARDTICDWIESDVWDNAIEEE